MKPIEKALKIATEAHKGQVDKNGVDYIKHPIAVSKMVQGTDAKIVALLHDVVEDTEWTLDDLQREGFSAEIISAVEAITKVKGEPRTQYLDRVKANPLALQVKLADIAHNDSPEREIKSDPEMAANLKKKYAYALAYLTAD